MTAVPFDFPGAARGPRLWDWLVLRAAPMVLLFVAMLLFSWNAHPAEEDSTLEQRVKAAFLYQFAGYVEWPPNSFPQPTTPISIAVMGADTVAAELSQVVTGRTIGGRSVTVKRVKPGESLAGVHILFVGRAESARLGQLAAPKAMLTVTETDGALTHGSMINFVLVERRVRFEIALDSAEKSGLKLSSRLLAVAQQVQKGTP